MMMRRGITPRLLLGVCLVTLGWACGPSLSEHAPAATLPAPAEPVSAAAPEAAAPVPAQAVVDPVLALINASDSHFRAGQKELDLGHVEAAKSEFNRAIDLLLESPLGGRTEPRLRDHFDRIVDRISAYELKALAEGDGFTEQRYEPASIDELLALSTTFGEPAPAPELQEVVRSELQATGHDIAIPLNARVLSYIELFKGRLHDFIEEGLTRGAKYLPMIQSVFRAEGLPLDLAYVPLIESAFNPNALSRAKAKGVWQFMAGTAAENGLHRDWYIDERSDPEKATLAAARYLKDLSDMFGGDWHLVLASYNGGPGRVQRAIKRTGVDDFWTLAEKPKLLARETREYVPMILAAIVIAKSPGQYGFADTEPQEPPSSEVVELGRPVDLRRVAEWAGTTIAEIQSLNPELRRWTTPLRDSTYGLRVPAGTGDRIVARLAEAPSWEVSSLNWYTVKRGETLPAVARMLRVSKADLADANYLSPAARVQAGQKLLVPRETTSLMAARTPRGVPPVEARPISTQSDLVAERSGASDRVKVIYHVKEGDTLSSIARLYKTTVSALRTWNNLLGNQIHAGNRLTVWALRSDRTGG
jgi:membrane-bound lytic murein transglycosylase D